MSTPTLTPWQQIRAQHSPRCGCIFCSHTAAAATGGEIGTPPIPQGPQPPAPSTEEPGVPPPEVPTEPTPEAPPEEPAHHARHRHH